MCRKNLNSMLSRSFDGDRCGDGCSSVYSMAIGAHTLIHWRSFIGDHPLAIIHWRSFIDNHPLAIIHWQSFTGDRSLTIIH